MNQSNIEYHLDADFYLDPNVLESSKLDITDPLLDKLQPKDKTQGTLAEQFAAPPASSSSAAEAAVDSRQGTSVQTEPDPSTRATSTIPEVNIESEKIITTRGYKQAQNLPNDTEYCDFLIELKNLVDQFLNPIESLYLEHSSS